MKVKGIIFDYGGTIDSNGMHWAEVIWRAYQANQVSVEKEIFRNAYVYGERTMGKNPLVQPHHNFLDMLRIKMHLQLDWLHANGYLHETMTDSALQESLAGWCYAYAKQSIEAAKPILRELAHNYPMVLVSNFYGNIETVLNDFGLDGLFQSIVESAVVGVRKPDPTIFRLGVDRLQLSASDIVVVGDSYDKDIVPATHIGCQTIWIKGIPWSPYRGDEHADVVIENFTDIRPYLLCEE